MKLEGNFLSAKFLHRPNRFLAYVKLENSLEEVVVHVPDPGRLIELLIPETEVIVRQEDSKHRKTKYSMVGVKYNDIWVNIDSIFTNKIFLEEFRNISAFKDLKIKKTEFTYRNSRFDFLMEDEKTGKETLVEIKGVTLVKEGTALFPDAPTARGTKHLKGLIEAVKKGYETAVVFIIKREDANLFKPNWDIDPKFSSILEKAHKSGVKIHSVLCRYDPVRKREITIIEELPILMK